MPERRIRVAEAGGPLDGFFYPSSVAVVGASTNPTKAGHQVLLNLKNARFPGPVYGVNPKEREILGFPCYPSVTQLPEPVELLLLTLPAEFVPDVVEEAARKGGVKAIVVLAAGFAETGRPEGAELERRLVAAAGAAGIRVMGPNCVGVMNTANRLDTTFAPSVKPIAGGLSIISQSGALGASLLMFSGDSPVPTGFAKFAHVGNQSDVSVLEVLRYYAADQATKVVGLYLEGVADGRGFMEAARAVTRSKPLLVLKVGKSRAGSAAAFSHTGSLAGSDRVYQGVFEQVGAVRVDTMQDLLGAAKALTMQPPPAGNGVCVLTEAGGPGTVVVDAISTSGYAEMAHFDADTVRQLSAILPPMAMVGKPDGYVDMTAAAMEEQHAAALRTVLADPGVNAVVLISVPPTFLSPRKVAEEIAAAVGAAAAEGGPAGGTNGTCKPVLVCLMAGDWVRPARVYLEERGIPTFDMPEQAARAALAMVRHRQLAAAGAERRAATGSSPGARATTRVWTEPEARRFLNEGGISTGDFSVAASAEEAAVAAVGLGLPVALKVVSRDIVHKTDAGGVRLGLATPEEVREAYENILWSCRSYNPAAAIDGVLVSPMVSGGVEVIAGLTFDPQFGHVVMVGLGGVLVELLEDVAFRAAPIARADAQAMLESLKGYRLLAGFRGQAKADLAALVDLLVKVSELPANEPAIRELDLNPVRVLPAGKGLAILDARLVTATK